MAGSDWNHDRFFKRISKAGKEAEMLKMRYKGLLNFPPSKNDCDFLKLATMRKDVSCASDDAEADKLFEVWAEAVNKSYMKIEEFKRGRIELAFTKKRNEKEAAKKKGHTTQSGGTK